MSCSIITIQIASNKKEAPSLIKKSIRYPVIYLMALTLWQGIFNGQIKWTVNLSICFCIFLAMLFIHWANKPYNWKKDKNKSY
jgi:hypothetical protein